MLQDEKRGGGGGGVYTECLIQQSSGEVASEPGDRLQVTHVATETAAACGDESPISDLL